MSSAAVSNGSPTSRRTTIDRSQSQENAVLDDDRLQYQPVSNPVSRKTLAVYQRHSAGSFSSFPAPVDGLELGFSLFLNIRTVATLIDTPLIILI